MIVYNIGLANTKIIDNLGSRRLCNVYLQS